MEDWIIYGRLIVTSHSIWWTSYIPLIWITSWPTRSFHPDISTNKMSLCHLSPNPCSKRWQICTGCLFPQAHDQMPSPPLDFNPIWNFSRNINFNLFIIERLSHKAEKMVQLISIEPRSILGLSWIRFPRSFLTKKLSIFQWFLLSCDIVRVTERMLSMKMSDNRDMSLSGSCNIQSPISQLLR